MDAAEFMGTVAQLSFRDRPSGMEELFKLLAKLTVYLLLGARSRHQLASVFSTQILAC